MSEDMKLKRGGEN